MQRFRLIIIGLFVAFVSIARASWPHTLERGVELYNDGRWIDSRLCLLEVKDNISTDNSADLEGVDFYLAMCAIELDDAEAECYISDFEKRYPASSYLNRVHFAKALLYCSDERYTEAKASFRLVRYSSLTLPQREEYNMRMGYILFLDKDYAEALSNLEAISPKSPVYHHALYYRSYIAYIQNDNQVARTGFTELLQSDAYSLVAPFYLLQIDFNDGNYSEVLSDGEALFGKATAARQRELARAMAEAAYKLEDYTSAVRYMGLYRNLMGEMAREENYILGFSLYRQARYQDAVDYLRLASGADDALTQNASYHLADCYLRMGDKASASKSFALAANDAYSAEIAEDALFNYAKLQYELGNDHFNETINALTRYINRYPAKTERYEDIKELLIATYYNSRDYNAAYKSIKELNTPDSDIRLALQRICLYRGLGSYNAADYAAAVAQIRESLTINISPKYSSIARFYLGEINFIRGDYQLALDNYNAYIVAAPVADVNYSLALYNIGYAKRMLNADSEAIGYYQRFVESSPSDTYYRADAYNRAGDIFYEKRQFVEAKENYKHASWSTYDPKYYALYQIAIIDGITGDYNAKIKRLNTIVSIGDGDYVEASMYELGRSYIAASEYKDGVDTHLQFIKKYPSSTKYAQALSELGLAYLNLGDRSASLTYYDKAIKASPQSSVAKDALQGVREIYINDGNANGYFKYAASVGYSGDLDNMMRDSLSFTSAQRLYLNSEGRSQGAINSLTEYINDYPQGYYTVDALFYLSDSYVKTGKNSEAIATLLQLLKKGANQYSERAYDRLSSLSFAEKMYSQSADAYLELYKISAKTDAKNRAIDGYVEATLMCEDDKSTLKMAKLIEQEASVSGKLLVKVKHAKALVLYAKGNVLEAMSIFKELSADPNSFEGAEATYILIESAFNSGNVDVAETMIFDFAKSDTSQLDFLARAFIILGDIYVLRGDNFQARATYQSIIDGYAGEDQSISKLARTKIDKLQ
ncbi:MAG: tetratricopeptide repeat protein [Rikenellaceae bacterium]